MPASNVSWPQPLTRQWPLYPGQWGVRGSDTELGLRMHTDGVVLYVNPNHPDRNDSSDGTDPDHPLATVTAALTKVAPYRGDVIAVMANNAWSYGSSADGYANPVNESVTVSVPGVRIVGISQSSSTGVVWQPGGNAGWCITVNAIDVGIEGFLFIQGNRTGANGIRSIWNGTTAFGDNLTVKNCTFDPTIDVAIYLDYTWNANIHHNNFFACDDTGIDVNHANVCSYLVISDNIFNNVATAAMDLYNVEDSFVFNNSIYNATAQGGGASVDMGITTATGARNQVYDNYFSCLLPVPGNGDWNDLNTAAATDAWINNHCLDGMAVTNPT